MPLYTDQEFTTAIIPAFLKQDERELVRTAVELGWVFHIGKGTGCTLIAPDDVKKIHLNRRTTIPITRMRKDVLRYADPERLAALDTKTAFTKAAESNGSVTEPTTPAQPGKPGATMPTTTKKAAATKAAASKATTMPTTITADGTNITACWEAVTPTQARTWLTRNDANRKIITTHVARLARDMTEGRYQITHQGVALSENGELLDGQHRLSAIVESNTTQTMLVTRGLPDTTQKAMDGGRKRSVADFLGGSHVNMRQAAARLLIATRDASPNPTTTDIHYISTRLTTSEILDRTRPQDAEALEALSGIASQAARNTPALGPSPVLAGTVLLIPDWDAAEQYLSALANLTLLPDGDPRIALMKVRGRVGRRFNMAEGMAYVMRATRAYTMGREVRLLRSIPGGTPILDLAFTEDGSVAD